MTLFNFDSGPEKPRRNRKLIALISIGAIAGAITLSTTLAAKLTLNTNGTVEFGQGVVETTSCDSNGIKITPMDSFYNSDGAGTFTFNAIQLEHISANCAGKDLVVKVYDNNGDAVALTQDENSSYTQARIYFKPLTADIQIAQLDGDSDTVSSYGYWAEQFALIGGAPIQIASLGNLYNLDPEVEPTPGNSALDYFALDPDENSLQIAFDPSDLLAAGFADAKNVYRISIESTDHVI